MKVTYCTILFAFVVWCFQVGWRRQCQWGCRRECPKPLFLQWPQHETHLENAIASGPLLHTLERCVWLLFEVTWYMLTSKACFLESQCKKSQNTGIWNSETMDTISSKLSEAMAKVWSLIFTTAMVYFGAVWAEIIAGLGPDLRVLLAILTRIPDCVKPGLAVSWCEVATLERSKSWRSTDWQMGEVRCVVSFDVSGEIFRWWCFWRSCSPLHRHASGLSKCMAILKHIEWHGRMPEVMFLALLCLDHLAESMKLNV